MTAVLDRPLTLEVSPVQARPRIWAGFAVVLAAMILNILDSTIVNVAAPSIRRDLSMSTSALEWIAAAYTLAIAVGLMAGGRLGDMFGRKRMLLIGLSGFVLASAACALFGKRAMKSSNSGASFDSLIALHSAASADDAPDTATAGGPTK